MENDNQQNEMDEEEDEDSRLKRELMEIHKEIENSKKLITQKNEELKKETEEVTVYERIILDKKEEIARIEESIKMVNDRMGDTNQGKKFIDALRNRKVELFDDCVFELLQYVKLVENVPEALNWVKGWEAVNKEKILKTEKLKLMKHLGGFFESTEKLFNIDNITFNDMQSKIEKLFIKVDENKDSPDVKTTNTIHIKVMIKEYVAREEIEAKIIDFDRNDYYVYNISIIEYDFLYEITNKFSILAIKSMVCNYFGLEEDKHLLVNEKFEIWPYDIILYNLIFNMNMEKGFVKPHSKFFHLNAAVTERLKFIIIKKEFMIELCSISFDNFRFIEGSGENIIGRAMKSKIEEIKTNMKFDKEMDDLRKMEKAQLTKDEIKEALLKLLRDVYKREEGVKPVYEINNVNSNEFDQINTTNAKNKKKRTFNKPNQIDEATTLTMESKHFNSQFSLNSNKPKISPLIKKKLNLEYSQILSEFNMTIDNFIEYCDQIINNQRRIGNLLHEEEKEADFDESDSTDDRLYKSCIQIILKNKESSLAPKKSLLKDEFEQKYEYYVSCIVDDYLKKEESERYEQRVQLKENRKKEQEKNEEEVVYVEYEEVEAQEEEVVVIEGKQRKTIIDYDEKIPWWLRIIEFLSVIVFIVVSHMSVTVVPSSQASFMNEKLAESYNLKQNCLKSLGAVQSPFMMNQWIYECYYPSIKTYYFPSFEEAEKNNAKIAIPICIIAIESFKMKNCDNYDIFNSTFKSPPKCHTTEYEDYYNRKKLVIDTFNLYFSPSVTRDQLGYLELLFFDNIRLDNPVTISILDLVTLDNFSRYIEFVKNLVCESKNYELSTCVKPDKANEGSLAVKLISELNEEMRSQFVFDTENNNFEIVDLTTKNLYLYTYYVSTELDLFGGIVFQYAVKEASISTNYLNIVNRLNPATSPFVDPIATQRTDDVYLYGLLFCIALMIFIWYLKSRFLNKFNELINRSFFFIMFLIVIMFENFFKIYHMIHRSTDWPYVAILLIDEDLREKGLLYGNNLKIIKSISILCLSYHLIYVVFPVKDLVVFTISLKPVYQRFFIVLVLIMFGVAIMITIFLGPFFVEYSSFISSFFYLFNYALGVGAEPATGGATLPVRITSMKFYFDLANYALRLIVLNFSMITMFFFYRKSYNYYESLNAIKNEEGKMGQVVKK